MLLLSFVVVTILCYFWLRHRYTYWERHGVKGPKPVFFFGNLFKSLTLQEHHSIAPIRWYNTFNDVPFIGFYKLSKPAILIRDPELQREILVKAFSNFHDNDANVSADDDLRSTNPFFKNGESWQRGRTYFGSFFSANKIRQTLTCVLEVGREWEQFIRSLGENVEVDAKDVCSRYTVESMIRSTFSIDGRSFEQQAEFVDMGKSMIDPDPITAIKMMVTFFVQDILKYLNVAQFIGLNETEIAGICFAFFFEAYDTTPNTLVLALYQLAKHPHIQDKLVRTIEEAIAANNNEITYDLVQKHEYLEKVLYETMRAEPFLFGLLKLCTKDYTMPLLPGQKIPVTIPATTPIVLPFAAVYKDPIYFPNPDVFDPERFSPEQKLLRPKSAFMPFGDGPRMCIGMQLGLFNMKMGLFEMIRYFHVKLGPNNKPFELHPMSFSNVAKNGVKIILTPRKRV
ncbi:hypothetical protein HA402_009482 [Bradysia odoriphaga]|nr:hypothetical protein HA402_009482 [Bradysia odoriphaga]